MNKNIVMLAVLLICGVAVAGVYMLFTSQQKKSAQKLAEQQRVLAEQTMKEEPLPQEPAKENMPTEKEAEEVSVPEGATPYVLTEANAQYSIVKSFIKKAAITVVGKTSFVSGNGWYDAKKHTAAVSILLSSTTVKSDIAQRDKDIDPLFTNKDIKLQADFKALPTLTDTPVKITAPVKLTINNITKEVPMNMMISLSSEGGNILSGEGSSDIKMSDFSIVPPSRLNMFTVPDDLTISFSMKASPKPATEETTEQGE